MWEGVQVEGTTSSPLPTLLEEEVELTLMAAEQLNGEEIVWEDEVELILSLLPDSQLHHTQSVLEEMIVQKVYQQPKCPFSCASFRYLIFLTLRNHWRRKGKDCKIVNGEVVVCDRLIEDVPNDVSIEEDNLLPHHTPPTHTPTPTPKGEVHL